MITYIDGIELLNRHPMSTNELENPFNTPIRQILGDKQMNEFYPKYVTNDDYKHKLDNIFERFHVVKHNNLEMQNLIRDYYNYMNDDLFLHITKERFIEIIKQGLNQSDYLNNVDKVLFLTALEEFG